MSAAKPEDRPYTKTHILRGVMAAGDRETCEHEAMILVQLGREIQCDHCDVRAVLDRVAPSIARNAAVKALRDFAADMEAGTVGQIDDWGFPSASPSDLTRRAESLENS